MRYSNSVASEVNFTDVTICCVSLCCQESARNEEGKWCTVLNEDILLKTQITYCL